jgi:gluconate 5-dehydrogenase
VSADWLGLRDQRVLVAGGCGTIGAAVVDGFLAAGAQVAITDLDDQLDGLSDDRVSVRVPTDLSDPDAARRSVASAREQLGGLDVFVHSVGINDRRPIDSYSAADWDRFIAINLTSAFHTAAAALPEMRAQGHGRLLFFSSVAGRSGHKLHGPYAATKGAINQLMRVIAHENADSGITANAVAPGYMDTALTHQYLEDHPDKRRALIELIPAGRFGQLAEVVDPVLFLCSPRASFITGQVIYIDGGRTIV